MYACLFSHLCLHLWSRCVRFRINIVSMKNGCFCEPVSAGTVGGGVGFPIEWFFMVRAPNYVSSIGLGLRVILSHVIKFKPQGLNPLGARTINGSAHSQLHTLVLRSRTIGKDRRCFMQMARPSKFVCKYLFHYSNTPLSHFPPTMCPFSYY